MEYTPAFKTKYRTEVVKTLQEQFKYKSSMEVPRLASTKE